MSDPSNLSIREQSASKDELWGNCLLYIKDRIQDQAFQTWFDGIIATNLNEEGITLQVPNQFHYEWLESKYRNLIDNALKEYASHPLIVNYSIVISDKSIEEIPTLTSKEKPVPPGYQRKSQLNSRYIFENFIEGKSNQFAKAAALSVSETPGQTPYNPLLIYSNPGLGKTHLLQAIGNKLIMHNKNMRVVYLTSEKFMLDFISSIQKNRSTDFINNYRNVDMLLLDDAQFFQSKEQTQEQFFHLFNDLFQQGKQIVLTTDRHPNELTHLKDRLVSRFQSGLIVDIQPPDLETRIAILMKKAENEKLNIPYDVTEFLAASIKNDIRMMEGAMVKLLALSSLTKQDITLSLVKKVIKNILGESALKKISMKQICKIVASEMEITEPKLYAKSRIADVVAARHVAMFLCRELTQNSLIHIGNHFGKREHATVIHACKTIEGRMAQDAHLNKLIDNIKTQL